MTQVNEQHALRLWESDHQDPAFRAFIVAQDFRFQRAILKHHLPRTKLPAKLSEAKYPAPYVVEERAKVSRPHGVLNDVARRYGVTVAEIQGLGRKTLVRLARQEAMYRLYRQCGLSSTGAGMHVNRDHSTTLHGIRRHEDRIKSQARQKLSPLPADCTEKAA